jgi:CMP-N,N'-diacetyllegionaminic acid synthase
VLGADRVVAVIPARGGSKKVPGKNIRPLAGRPLLAWSVAVGKKVVEIDRVVVSTDDDAIALVAEQTGAEVYRRPPHLATDTSLVVDTLRHLAAEFAAEGETADVMVLLEPTSPLRTADDVRDVLHLMARKHLDSVATFTDACLNPHRAWRIDADHQPEVFIPGAVPWLPRQALPAAYQLNGAVYAFRMAVLRSSSPALLAGRMGAIVMPKERSIDIDDDVDFAVAELLLRKGC